MQFILECSVKNPYSGEKIPFKFRRFGIFTNGTNFFRIITGHLTVIVKIEPNDQRNLKYVQLKNV